MPLPPRIGIVGAGWRAEAYLRVARERPDLFDIERFLVRSDAGVARLNGSWGVDATTSEADFLHSRPDFVIVCVDRESAAAFTRRFAASDVPVLCETPLAPDLESTAALHRALGDAAPVQVAEQYRYQPHHAARLRVAGSGVLGRVRSVRMSVAHEYHAVSLIRQALGVGFQNALVDARSVPDASLAPLGRKGWRAPAPLVESERVTARFTFDDGSVADYDFSDEQYFSPIRSRHVLFRGERGEIADDDVRYLTPEGEAVHLRLARQETGVDGDLEGRFLRGISLGAEMPYRNPLAPARLSDDELAIGTVLLRMSEFVRTGVPFYGIPDAAQDHHLALAMRESIRSGRSVSTQTQPWAA
jgi:hypothetical protein